MVDNLQQRGNIGMKHLHGGDIYRNRNMLDFSANINPLGMPEQVKEAAKRGIDYSESYPDVECQTLREALSRIHSIPYEHIICGNGAADLIFAMGGLQLKKALILAPTFAEYEQSLKNNLCEIKYYNLEEKKDFKLDKDYITYLKESKDIYDVIFLCNPNNPTGQVMEKEFLLEVLKICQEKEIFLVIDECFVDFLENPSLYSMIPYVEQYSNLFILKAFTKLYAMAGLRLGYGICSNTKQLEKMADMLQPWNVSTPAQLAGVEALKQDKFVQDSRVYIKQEKEFLLKHMIGNVDKIYGHSSNYIFFKAEKTLLEQMKQSGILIRDCSNYINLTKGFYRIAVRTREENRRFIEVLSKRSRL